MFDVSEFSDSQLQKMLSKINMEIHNRALDSGDPDVLGQNYMESLATSELGSPKILTDRLLALGGVIKYNGTGTRHTCSLYSVYVPGTEPFWAWEDNGFLEFSNSVRIGEHRYSASVLTAIHGMQFIRHNMKHDGERHKRISEEAYECVWEGNKFRIVRSEVPPRNLPVPANH